MLALFGVDWLLGTSLVSGPDWILQTKLTAIAAFFVWGIFLYAPANILAHFLEGPRDRKLPPWRSRLKRVRPMVGAIALCLGLYGGYQVFDHAPPLPQWEGEYVTPKTDVWLAQSALRSFETLARKCLPEVDAFGIRRWHAKVLDTPPPPPLSPRCNRPDVLDWARRWEARFLVEWATELAPSRNAVPTWVEQG